MKDTMMLAPYVRVGIQNNILYFGFGSIQKIIKESNLQKIYIAAAKLWLTPKPKKLIFDELTSLGFSEENVKNCVKDFENSNFLIPEDSYNKSDRYSRHSLYYSMNGGDSNKIQNRIENSHVVILGCGGIGNQISVSLATAGIGKLTLVDADQIELSNLTRQILFTEADEGKNKIDILERELNKRSKSTQIDKLNLKIDSPDKLNQLPSCDLIVVSADAGNIVSLVNKYSMQQKVAYINAGYVEDIAVWGPFVIPGKTGCWECQSLIAETKYADQEIQASMKEINQRFQIPSVGSINMLASAGAIVDIVKFLGGFGEIQSLNKRIGIWTHELKIETQDCSKNSNCKICGGLNVI